MNIFLRLQLTFSFLKIEDFLNSRKLKVSGPSIET